MATMNRDISRAVSDLLIFATPRVSGERKTEACRHEAASTQSLHHVTPHLLGSRGRRKATPDQQGRDVGMRTGREYIRLEANAYSSSPDVQAGAVSVATVSVTATISVATIAAAVSIRAAPSVAVVTVSAPESRARVRISVSVRSVWCVVSRGVVSICVDAAGPVRIPPAAIPNQPRVIRCPVPPLAIVSSIAPAIISCDSILNLPNDGARVTFVWPRRNGLRRGGLAAGQDSS